MSGEKRKVTVPANKRRKNLRGLSHLLSLLTHTAAQDAETKAAPPRNRATDQKTFMVESKRSRAMVAGVRRYRETTAEVPSGRTRARGSSFWSFRMSIVQALTVLVDFWRSAWAARGLSGGVLKYPPLLSRLLFSDMTSEEDDEEDESDIFSFSVCHNLLFLLLSH
jgi:hypothetical protein